MVEEQAIKTAKNSWGDKRRIVIVDIMFVTG
jgi:hypothetical protein